MDSLTPDETALLEAFRACQPEGQARLLGQAKAQAAGRPHRTMSDLLAAARKRGRDVAEARVAIARAVGDPLYRLVVKA